MGFLDDLGDFLGEVSKLGDEITSVKEEFVASIIKTSSEIKELAQDTVADIEPLKKTLTDGAKQLEDNVRRGKSPDQKTDV